MHFRWLETVKFEQPVQQIVFQEYVDTVHACGKRVDGLDEQLERVARESAFWPVIEALMALRGVNLLTAATIMAEIGDLHRFASAPQLMAYLGLVPSEHSSGPASPRRHHQDRQRPCAPGAGRGGVDLSPSGTQDGAPAAPRGARVGGGTGHRLESAEAAMRTLSAIEARGKLKVQACTAVARELAGFIWAIGQAVPRPDGEGRSSIGMQRVGSRMGNGGRTLASVGGIRQRMILDGRARQLPDESVVMRYPTREYQTDQPSAGRPFCYQHAVQKRKHRRT